MREGLQSSYGVGIGETEIQVYIREGPLGLTVMTFQQDGSHAEHVHRLGQQHIRSRALSAFVQML